MNKARIRAIEKRLRLHGEYGPLRVWTIYTDDDNDYAAKVEQIKAGKVRHPDGGLYRPGESNLFIHIVRTSTLRISREWDKGGGHAD